MKDLRETTAEYLKRLGEEYKKGIRDNMTKMRRHASHETERSLEAVVENKGFVVNLKVLGKAKSATYLQSGWQPARRKESFVGVILNWMEDKGLASGNLQQDVSSAAAIAHQISTKGTLLYQNRGTIDIYSRMVMDSESKIEKKLQTITTLKIYQTNEEFNPQK